MIRGLRSASRTLLLSPRPTLPKSSSSSSMSTAAALYVSGVGGEEGGGEKGVVPMIPKYVTEMAMPSITVLDNGITVVSSYRPSG